MQAIEVAITRVNASRAEALSDCVALEEPLEIRVGQKSLSITMRTPGHDRELAAGFLFTEGIVRDRAEIESLTPCKSPNVIRAELPRVSVTSDRHFYMTSSCGVCGKASLEALMVKGIPPVAHNSPVVTRAILYGLPEKLREAQAVFERTGGLHAAGLFDAEGSLLCLREDVGRHNAVDKVVGAMFLEGRTPLAQSLLLVSGRASFELVQKAVVAGIPMLVAVGAPSSLAVELAKRFGLTLVGFLRDGRFNLYSGEWRVEGLA